MREIRNVRLVTPASLFVGDAITPEVAVEFEAGAQPDPERLVLVSISAQLPGPLGCAIGGLWVTAMGMNFAAQVAPFVPMTVGPHTFVARVYDTGNGIWYESAAVSVVNARPDTGEAPGVPAPKGGNEKKSAKEPSGK